MAKFEELELALDSQGKYGSVQPFHAGKSFALPELNGSSIAVPLSTASLTASASFTGTARDRLNLTDGATAIAGGIPLTSQAGVLISKYKGIVYTDQAGTLYIEESNDNATWTQSATVTVSANQFVDSGWVYLSKRYYRLRYVNGATTQTTFSLFESAGAGQSDTLSTLTGSNATLVNGSYNQLPSISAGNTETVNVVADNGKIAKIINVGYSVSAPPSATTGTHTLQVYYGDTLDANMLLNATYAYNESIQLWSGFFVGVTSDVYPSDNAAQIASIKGNVISDVVPIIFYYENNTNVAQTNERYCKVYRLQGVITG